MNTVGKARKLATMTMMTKEAVVDTMVPAYLLQNDTAEDLVLAVDMQPKLVKTCLSTSTIMSKNYCCFPVYTVSCSDDDSEEDEDEDDEDDDDDDEDDDDDDDDDGDDDEDNDSKKLDDEDKQSDEEDQK